MRPLQLQNDAQSWHDWRWQLRHAITDLAGLQRALSLTPSERRGAQTALRGGLSMAITPYYMSLCDRADPDCPVRKQCVPRAEEAEVVPGDLRDPLGEDAHSPAPNLIRRYPDRVLLLATDRCSVYCRFCTRSRMVGDGGGARSMTALSAAFAYIESDPTIRDVIISGGDPCVMSTAKIVALLERLAQIDHVDTVRLATRTPVTLPQRITGELCQAIASAHPAVWVMTHFNHPKELTRESTDACARLIDAGLPVMNQTVLLRGVNDDVQTLTELFRGLIRHRVRPYYLMQMDPVRGSAHLRTPLSVGEALIAQLQGQLSGIAIPKFIVDTPGGHGKVHIAPSPIVTRTSTSTTLCTHRGTQVDYIDPPDACATLER